MFQHRHVAPDPGGQILIDPGGCPADAVRDLGDQMTPGIDNHRMAIGETGLTLAFKMLSPGRWCCQPALRLDRPAADQRFPVILAGRQRERAGQEDDFRALLP